MRAVTPAALSGLAPTEIEAVAARWLHIAADAALYESARRALAAALGPDDAPSPSARYDAITEHGDAIGLHYAVVSSARWAWAATEARDRLSSEQFDILTGPWGVLRSEIG